MHRRHPSQVLDLKPSLPVFTAMVFCIVLLPYFSQKWIKVTTTKHSHEVKRQAVWERYWMKPRNPLLLSAEAQLSDREEFCLRYKP